MAEISADKLAEVALALVPHYKDVGAVERFQWCYERLDEWQKKRAEGAQKQEQWAADEIAHQNLTAMREKEMQQLPKELDWALLEAGTRTYWTVRRGYPQTSEWRLPAETVLVDLLTKGSVDDLAKIDGVGPIRAAAIRQAIDAQEVKG